LLLDLHRAFHSRTLFFNDTPTTELYTLSLHDALPICRPAEQDRARRPPDLGARRGRALRAARRPRHARRRRRDGEPGRAPGVARSEEHTSELQSLTNLVCRLLLEKKK